LLLQLWLGGSLRGSGPKPRRGWPPVVAGLDFESEFSGMHRQPERPIPQALCETHSAPQIRDKTVTRHTCRNPCGLVSATAARAAENPTRHGLAPLDQPFPPFAASDASRAGPVPDCEPFERTLLSSGPPTAIALDPGRCTHAITQLASPKPPSPQGKVLLPGACGSPPPPPTSRTRDVGQRLGLKADQDGGGTGGPCAPCSKLAKHGVGIQQHAGGPGAAAGHPRVIDPPSTVKS
jgi:hypothetical protein